MITDIRLNSFCLQHLKIKVFLKKITDTYWAYTVRPMNNFCPTLWQASWKTMTSLSHAYRSVSGGGSVKCFTLSQLLIAKQGPIRAWRL